MWRRLLMVALLGCACSSGGSQVQPDLANPLSVDLAAVDLRGADLRGTPDLVSSGSACNMPAECRLYSNNCDGCLCQALRTDEIDPVCAGSPVSCLIDPCEGKSATCSMGHCVIQ